MSSATPQTPANACVPALSRRLGLVALTIYGVGDMLGAGIYSLVGVIAAQMGNAIWMAFTASMVAAVLTGLTYASLGSRYPQAAGAAFVIDRAFGRPGLAYIIGLAIMASGLTSMAAASHAFAGYLQPVLAGFLHMDAGHIPIRAIVVVFLLVSAGVNFWGIRESAWLNALCTCVETAGLVFIIAIGVRYWGSINYLDVTSAQNPTGEFHPSLLLATAIPAFYAFIGFEDLLNVSEEVKNPRRTFPLAVVLALSATTLIYMAVAITAVSVVPHLRLAAVADRPLLEVVKVAAPWFPAGIFAGVAMFAVTNTALLNYIMGSRLAYGMARQGLLPAFMGRIHPRRCTPHVAILVLLALVLVLALAGNIRALASATALLLLTSFAVMNVALIRLKLRPDEPAGGFEVPLAVPVAGMLVCAVLIGNEMITSTVKFQRDLSGAGLSQALSHLLPLTIAGGLLLLATMLNEVRKRTHA